MSQIAKVETSKPQLRAGAAVTAIVPQDIEQVYRLSQVIAKAGMAPKSYNNDPEKIMIGILQGMEIGFTPMAALQSIAVIGNMPSVWGDGAMGLVQGSGLLEDQSETLTGTGEDMEAACSLKRAGRPSPIVGTFSVAKARKAGLWGKSGPWSQYPERMLQMRARAFALRDGFADVLRGIHITEEVRDFVPGEFTEAKDAPRLTAQSIIDQAAAAVEGEFTETPDEPEHNAGADGLAAKEVTPDERAYSVGVDDGQNVRKFEPEQYETTDEQAAYRKGYAAGEKQKRAQAKPQ